MNHMNMTGLNAVGGALGGMPLINNGTNGATPRAGSDQGDNDFEARLNTHIYDFFLKSENYECARVLLNSGVAMEPSPRRRDGDINGTDDAMHTDSKDDIDSKRPEGLPPVPGQTDNSNFLLEWYSCFWDFFFARTKNPRATPQSLHYMQATQQQNRLRAEHQHQMLRGAPGMGPGAMDNYQQMIRIQQANGMQINGDLRQKALQNNRNTFGQATPQQLTHMKTQQMMQQQMRRDPSDIEMNGQRPRTPSGDNNAPSPSKRPRLDGVPFNGQQMIPGARGPPQGLQGQPMMENIANNLLIHHGINPNNLSSAQMASFQNQAPSVQEKSISIYNQHMRQNQQRQSMSKPGMPGQGSPMMHQGLELPAGGTDFYPVNPQMPMRAGPSAANPAGGNHALQDYQMQLMLLEQQNKKRLLMARQEQDSSTRPEGQPGITSAQGFAPMLSPSGSRSGPSPGPSDQMKRGTPKMGPASLPGGGSPMPDGMPRQGGSPAAMTYSGQIPPEMFQMRMGENMGTAATNNMKPPSSHPQFGPYNPQQMEAMRRTHGGQIPNGNWPPGPQNQTIVQQPSQTQQTPSTGTPQQQRSMPPPTVPAGTTTNGRPASPAHIPAPATPSQSNKPNPKPKKDGKEPRKRPAKKNSTAGAGTNATPATDAENPPPTPTPSTPITPMNSNSFSQQPKNEGQTQTAIMQGVTSAPNAASLVQPQPDPSGIQQYSNLDEPNSEYAMQFNQDLNGDVLENFDFDSFLQSTTGEEFQFDASSLAFGAPDGVEAGAGES